MKQIGIKTDDTAGASGEISAEEFNSMSLELQNIVSRSGQTLLTPNNEQVAEASVVALAAGSCVDSGTPNTVVLTPTTGSGGLLLPTTYARFNGWPVSFYSANTNTGNMTVDIGQTAGSLLGVKKFLKIDGSEIASGEIADGQLIEGRYSPAADSGTGAWIFTNPGSASSVTGVYRNLLSNRPTVATITVTIDEIALTDTANSTFIARSVNETIDISASGDGGLDTGLEASSTWYFIWIIAKPDGTIGSVLSATDTTPTLPAGFTFKALVGAVYNNSGSDFIDFKQVDNSVVFLPVEVLSSGSNQPTYTSLDISTVVPITAKQIAGTLYAEDNSSTLTATYIASDSGGYGSQWIKHRPSTGTGGENQGIYSGIVLTETQTIYWKNQGAGAGDISDIEISKYSY
jgi:hypothetical protein